MVSWLEVLLRLGLRLKVAMLAFAESAVMLSVTFAGAS
jgi:hypothetical protein